MSVDLGDIDKGGLEILGSNRENSSISGLLILLATIHVGYLVSECRRLSEMGGNFVSEVSAK